MRQNMIVIVLKFYYVFLMTIEPNKVNQYDDLNHNYS